MTVLLLKRLLPFQEVKAQYQRVIPTTAGRQPFVVSFMKFLWYRSAVLFDYSCMDPGDRKFPVMSFLPGQFITCLGVSSWVLYLNMAPEDHWPVPADLCCCLGTFRHRVIDETRFRL